MRCQSFMEANDPPGKPLGTALNREPYLQSLFLFSSRPPKAISNWQSHRPDDSTER